MADRGTGTILYSASVLPLADEELYRQAYLAVSPQRRQKADRLRRAGDRRLSLGAGLLLRYALHEAGIDDGTLEYGADGKPYIKGNGVFFSLSHTGDTAVCALSDLETGCDVERIERCEPRVARRFFTAEEYEHIAAQPTLEAQKELFCRYWTLKESFIKAVGTGLRLPLNAFTIRLGEKITVTQSVDEREYHFREFDAIPGCRCAVCTAGECGDVEYKKVDLSEIFARLREEDGKIL